MSLQDWGQHVQGYIESSKSYFGSAYWIIAVIAILVLTIIISIIAASVISWFVRKAEKTRHRWDDVILKAARAPIVLIIWVLGISYSLSFINQVVSGEALFNFIGPARQLLIILSIIWFALRVIKYWEPVLKKPVTKGGKGLDHTTINAIGKISRVVVIALGIIIALPTMGYNITGLVAFGSVGTLALGFAGKDALANIFGGFMVFTSKPFRIGDWILLNNCKIEGTVTDISWRATTIMSFDKRPTYVPNGIFLKESIQNCSRMTHRRILMTVGVRYCDWKQIDSITKTIEEYLFSNDNIATEGCTNFVKFKNFGASSLDMQVYSFTKTTNWVEWLTIQQEVFLKILEIIDDHGAEVAFPTTTLEVPGGIDLQPEKESLMT